MSKLVLKLKINSQKVFEENNEKSSLYCKKGKNKTNTLYS